MVTPKPSKRVEGGGATGGLAFQTGVQEMINLTLEKMGKKPKKIVAGKFGYKGALQSVKNAGVFDSEEIDKLLLNFYRENTYLDRFVKEPQSFREYIKNYSYQE